MSRSIPATQHLRLSLAGVVALAALLTPLAHAVSEERVVQSGWWWVAQASPSAPMPVPYGTEPGELLVGRHANAQDKAAAVQIDLSDMDAAPKVLVVALEELDTSSDPLHSGDLLACPVHTGEWKAAQGGAWAARPRGGCVEPYATVGSREDTGRWTFDITAMATAWVDGTMANQGFELVPAQHLSAPSFEIGLRAPGPEDLYILGGSGSPASATVQQATVDASPPPSPVTQPVATNPAPQPLPSSTVEPIASGWAPQPTPAPAASPIATGDPAETFIRMVTSRSTQSNDAPTGLKAVALIACASVLVGWSRLRAASVRMLAS